MSNSLDQAQERVEELVQLLDNYPLSSVGLHLYECMRESFQDGSWIQDFEADFPQKVSLKMLN